MVPTLDLQRYLATFWKWWWLLLAAAVLAGGISYYLLHKMPPSYVSSSTIVVGDTTRNPKPGDEEFSTSTRLADTYAQLAQRQPILEATVRALKLPFGWEELRRRIVVVHQTGSLIIEIRASDTDPARARDIAAGVAQQLIESSPTAANRVELNNRRQFIREEIDQLQVKIEQARVELGEKREVLATETSARGVLDRQDEIKALEENLAAWRTNYSALLTAYDTKAGPNTLTVIEAAALPLQPAGPGLAWNVALAVLGGLLLAMAGILLIEYLDDAVKSAGDLEAQLGVPILGQAAREPSLGRAANKLLPLRAPDSPSAEAFRVFAANLRFAGLTRPGSTVLLTSTRAGEGKSTVAAGVALNLALGGKRVLLVDLDLRDPSQHTLFGLSNETGVTSLLLRSELRMEDCLSETPIATLKLLTSGPLPPNPPELLSRFGDGWVQRFRALADYVVVDSPPLQAGADALILAAQVEGTVLVVQAGTTGRRACQAALKSIERVGGRLIGTFLTAVPRRDLGIYGYSAARAGRGGMFGRWSHQHPPVETAAWPGDRFEPEVANGWAKPNPEEHPLETRS